MLKAKPEKENIMAGYTGFKDMFDGGGAGQSGDRFQGGGVISGLANLLFNPAGSKSAQHQNAMAPVQAASPAAQQAQAAMGRIATNAAKTDTPPTNQPGLKQAAAVTRGRDTSIPLVQGMAPRPVARGMAPQGPATVQAPIGNDQMAALREQMKAAGLLGGTGPMAAVQGYDPMVPGSSPDYNKPQFDALIPGSGPDYKGLGYDPMVPGSAPSYRHK
jgi:hypothetical protein